MSETTAAPDTTHSPEAAAPEIAGLPARLAALRLLDAVLRRGETLEHGENGALRGIAEHADRALARAIAGETLRWLVDLDALIDSATMQILPDDAKPRMVLRIMLAQWLRLATKPHAVVSTGLPLLEGGPRRWAHGGFGTLVRQGASLPDAPSLPAKVAERWGARAASIAAGLAVPPPLDLALRDPGSTAEWAQQLGGVSLAPGHVRLPRGARVEDLPGYADGAWWVQDFAASLPVRLLGPGIGPNGPRRVLDLAAAPGGKTLQLAAAGWAVTALDISAKRLALLHQNLARTGLSAEVITANALEWEPEAPFDAVLLDAPCTATGTARRHPDVLHRIAPRHIAELSAVQARLLARAAGWLVPGGRLVYAVCSLEREEGEGQTLFLPLNPDRITADELPAGLLPTAAGWLRTDPGMLAEAGGMDGFFIGRWQAG